MSRTPSPKRDVAFPILFIPETSPTSKAKDNIACMRKAHPCWGEQAIRTIEPKSPTRANVGDLSERLLDEHQDICAAVIPYYLTDDKQLAARIKCSFEETHKALMAWLGESTTETREVLREQYEQACSMLPGFLRIKQCVVAPHLINMIRSVKGDAFPIIVHSKMYYQGCGPIQPKPGMTGPHLYTLDQDQATNYLDPLVRVFAEGPRQIGLYTEGRKLFTDGFSVDIYDRTFYFDIASLRGKIRGRVAQALDCMIDREMNKPREEAVRMAGILQDQGFDIRPSDILSYNLPVMPTHGRHWC